jgi:serine/threonine protein kinase
VLHALGVAHNDVKPANILRAAEGGHLLCDFGNAVRWREGEDMCSQRGATQGFDILPGAFAASESSMYACDMEGLFWTVLALWLQVADKKDRRPRLSAAKRMNALLSLGHRGGVWRGENRTLKLLAPSAPVLVKYFGSVKTGVLTDPLDLFRSHKELFRGDETQWLQEVARREAKEDLPRCRPAVLRWLLKNR